MGRQSALTGQWTYSFGQAPFKTMESFFLVFFCCSFVVPCRTRRIGWGREDKYWNGSVVVRYYFRTGGRV